MTSLRDIRRLVAPPGPPWDPKAGFALRQTFLTDIGDPRSKPRRLQSSSPSGLAPPWMTQPFPRPVQAPPRCLAV